MIVFCLAEVAAGKGYNKSQLHRAANLSYPAVLRLWNSDQKPVKEIDVDVLDKLCALLDVDPGDLIKRTVTTDNQP